MFRLLAVLDKEEGVLLVYSNNENTVCIIYFIVYSPYGCAKMHLNGRSNIESKYFKFNTHMVRNHYAELGIAKF